MTIDPKKTVAEISRLYPAALPVFARYAIDLCCGGRHSLEEVARKHGIELRRLLDDIEEALRVSS